MSVAGKHILSKGEVMMYLALAKLNRTMAAKLAGVSRDTFFRAMRRYRIIAPKPQAKLSARQVQEIRSLLDKYTNKQLATMYKVHERTIEQVGRYETWRQVGSIS